MDKVSDILMKEGCKQKVISRFGRMSIFNYSTTYVICYVSDFDAGRKCIEVNLLTKIW